jgi:2-polyprenyl-3-methyl-5-hydroxy-6-metoxy-1,4-benzoquinol methylase
MGAARACPACGGHAAQHVHRVKLRTPDGHPLQGGYDVVSCTRCGAGYADVAVGQEVYDRYYAERAKYAADAATLANTGDAARADPPWVTARFDATAARIARLVPPGGRVLDVGCATGSLLAALRRRGVRDVRGLDPSPGSAAVAACLHGVPVDVGALHRPPAGLGTFDCVCLTGVLEHVWDVDGAMVAITSLLAPGGVVYVEVPDASRYLDPFIAPFEDFHTEHVNHFSVATLATLGRRFGFGTAWTGAADNELVPGATAAVAAVCWRQPAAGVAPRLRRDEALVASLRAFTARSADAWRRMDDRLRRDLGPSPTYVLWGMGELSMKLLADTVLAERPPAALVDGNPARHGLCFDGVPVGAPGDVRGGTDPIVLGSLLRAASIRATIEGRGLTNPVITLDAA